MSMRHLVFAAALLGLFAGTLLAITGANVGTATQTRWNGVVTAGSLSTQGGNITTVNINSSQLTSKWAAFSGNVSGFIVLGDSSNTIYSWTYSTANGGEVCLSTNSSQPFTSPGNATTGGIDTAFSTTGAPDNAAGTFNTTCPALAISTGALTGFIAARTQGSSSFTTCAGNSSGSAAANHYFCTIVNSTGKNYLNGPANFEIIVPASGAQTYFFYFQLT